MKINNFIYKLVFTSLFFVLLSASDKSYALTVIPSIIELNSTPNSQETFVIKVRNDEGKKRIIKSYSWDLALNKDGKYEKRPIGGFDYSLAKNIRTLKEETFLEANEMKEIYFTLKVPNDIQGEKQAIIYIQSIPDLKAKKGRSVIFSTKIAVPVFLKIKGTESIKSKIKNVKVLEPTKKEGLSILLNVINDGNVHIKSSASISIVSDDYSLFVGSIKTDSQIVLPNGEKHLKGELNRDITAGKYRALITYEYDDKNIVIEKPFEIK